MKRLRVLTISKPYVGAAYRHKLGLWAARGDMDVSLICPPAWGTQKFESVPPGDTSEGNVDIRILPIILNNKNHFHLYRNLEKTMAELKPDIVNVEEEHYSAVTWQCFRAALNVGAKPMFYTWQNINKSYPPPFSWIENYVFKHAKAGVAGNAEASAILIKKGYKGPVREIPQMGVNFSRFAPLDTSTEAKRAQKKSVGLDDECFWIGFAGRLVEEKGIHDLIRALYLIPQNLKARLAIIGSGPQHGGLQYHVETLGMQNKVKFIDFVDSADMPKWLQSMDVLCLPSLTRSNWKEQFGRILVEAMAAGAVVVGSSSGEIPRVIGDAGRIFPEGDHAELGKTLTTLAADPDLCAKLRSAGTQRVEQCFTNDVIAESFASLFHEVAAR